MKIQVAGQKFDEKIMTLKLEQDGDEISVVNNAGWCLITFLVNEDENLVFKRTTSVGEDEGVELDDEQRIVEVDE